MGEPQEVQLHMTAANGAKETHSMEDNSFPSEVNQSIINRRKRYYRWFRIALYAAFALVGQSAATLFGRLYYDKGGKSKWLGTLVQVVGFPILLPYYCILASKIPNTNGTHTDKPSPSMLALVYVSTGLLVALYCYLYSIGFMYLPVSTYSLICSSQLAFNAFFSKFLNSLKFTPYIINSLVLLTISSALLAFQPAEESSGSAHVSKKKYAIGFICTIAASAGFGLLLSLMQFAFRKILKSENFKVVMDMIIYQTLVAALATLVGFFASGEWKDLNKEMEEYEMGKASYVLNLTFAAINWQLVGLGLMGLIFEVSSLFSNAISILGVPLVPILAVIFFQDKMHGIKAISMVLAVWGFISYVYQQYLDESKSNTENINARDVPNASPLQAVNR